MVDVHELLHTTAFLKRMGPACIKEEAEFLPLPALSAWGSRVVDRKDTPLPPWGPCQAPVPLACSRCGLWPCTRDRA